MTFTKQYKLEVDDDLTVYVDEHRPSIVRLFLNPSQLGHVIIR